MVDARTRTTALADEIVARLPRRATTSAGRPLVRHPRRDESSRGWTTPRPTCSAHPRRSIGPDVIVSASMDLHGNVTARARAPGRPDHLLPDGPARGRHGDARSAPSATWSSVLSTRPVGSQRPVKAWVPIPVLLPGEQTSTRLEPAGVAVRPGARRSRPPTACSTPRSGSGTRGPTSRATVPSSSSPGGDRDAVAAGAERLAPAFWDVREDFVFVAPTGTFDECLDAALAPGAARPYFISRLGRQPDRRRRRAT